MLLSTIQLYGQLEWAPIGATWYYSRVENFAGEEGYTKIVSERDTIIEGKPSKILSQTYHSVSGEIFIKNDIFTYQNGDTVFYWIDNAFRPFYNFSLKRGDTFEIYSKTIMCPGNTSHFGKVKVDSIGSITINNIQLKQFFTSPIMGSAYKLPGSYIEVIGGINGIFPVDTGCSADIFPEIGKLRCYYDKSIGFYHFPNKPKCDSILKTGIRNYNNNEIKVSYNPIIKAIIIDLNNQNINTANNIQIMIYDIIGNNIYNSGLKASMQNIIVPINFTKGIYIIKIFNYKNLLYHEKYYIY